MKILLGPMTRDIAVRYYARFDVFSPGLLELLRSAPVPAEIQREAEAARVLELRDQAIRDSRESGLLESEEHLSANTRPGTVVLRRADGQ